MLGYTSVRRACAIGATLLGTLVPAAAAQAATETFSFTGEEQVFTVPAGVISIDVTAAGGAGGSGSGPGSNGAGGSGALVGASLPVTPGQVLYVEVGSLGEAPVFGFCNGAGRQGVDFGTSPDAVAGAGGGATDVRTVSVMDGGGSLCGGQSEVSLESRVLVAAGGGGGGAGRDGGPFVSGDGGDAGKPGEGGSAGRQSIEPGQPGTSSAGGAGGFGQHIGGGGTLGAGGQGGGEPGGGGGGGGGLYGGGGGGSNGGGAGGGGGSSLVPDGGTLALTSEPAGVTISYTPDLDPPETTITSGPTGVFGAGNRTNDSTPTFEFESDEPGSSFACSVDGGAFAACTSPHTTASLADGQHTFAVRATDRAGNEDQTPASVEFNVQPRCSLVDARARLGGTPLRICLVEQRSP